MSASSGVGQASAFGRSWASAEVTPASFEISTAPSEGWLGRSRAEWRMGRRMLLMSDTAAETESYSHAYVRVGSGKGSSPRRAVQSGDHLATRLTLTLASWFVCDK